MLAGLLNLAAVVQTLSIQLHATRSDFATVRNAVCVMEFEVVQRTDLPAIVCGLHLERALIAGVNLAAVNQIALVV